MISFPFTIIKKNEAHSLLTKIQKLESDVAVATTFIKGIENGNLDTALLNADDDIDQNSLSASLLSMRDKMKHIAEQEKERNWSTEGLARFVEILRSNNHDIKQLSEDILSNLVTYLGANQGYLFIVGENDSQEVLELTACYAYNKKKYIQKTILPGEGMVGQCFLEKETIYMSDVPKNYVHITSGLGEALPGNILIVPLKINDDIFGIIEIASFHKVKPYQVEFLEKLGESIASTISTVKVNERTKKLLGEAQAMTQQMRSQEEEMRQNMEELSATQEEMQRRQCEINDVNTRFDLVNKSASEGVWDLIYSESSTALDQATMWYSAQFYKILGYTEGGFTATADSWASLIHPEDKPGVFNAFGAHLADASGNTPFDVNYRINTKSGLYRWVKSRGTTLRNEAGSPVRTAGSLKDIHEEVTAINETQRLLAESRQREEALKAQEEELRQNMEELTATQEELEKRKSETEDVRRLEKERADTQIATQKKMMEQYVAKNKQRETELLERIQQLESQFMLQNS